MTALEKLVQRCNEMDMTEQDQWLGDVFMSSQALEELKRLAAELSRLREIEAERDAWRSALQSLTPGGSEFTEPHECSNWVKGHEGAQRAAIIRMKRERDALREYLNVARGYLTDLIKRPNDYTTRSDAQMWLEAMEDE